MLTFTRSLDPHCLNVVKAGQTIAFLHKHLENEPRLVLSEKHQALTLDDLRQCVARLDVFLVEGK